MSSGDPSHDLGSHVDGIRTQFRLRSGSSSAVDLCLLDADPGRTPGSLSERRHPMTRCREGTGRWEIALPVPAGTRYGYRVHGDWDPEAGRRANPAKLLLDPYARAVDLPPDPGFPARPELVGYDAGDHLRADARDSARWAPWSVVVGPSAPTVSTRPDVPWSYTVIYEAHVGHLTRRHPAVPAADRGRFTGLAHPAVIEHLSGLGVTTVELLPVHQFVSEPALVRRGAANAWGYNTLGFFAPHAAYGRATDPAGREQELADAVQALHAAGIEVVLDVVFNHTAEGPADGPTYHLRGLDNAAYYRLDPHDRSRYVDWTGCGNTLDGRSPAVVELVLDSLRHWARRYDIDGYRFDLAPALGRTEVDFDPDAELLRRITSDPVVGPLKLIAEPWDLGPGGYRLGGFDRPGRAPDHRWSEWNDRYRDDLRSFWRPGRADVVPGLVRGLAGSSHVFQGSGRAPYHSVNFITAHDGFTLRDLVSYEHKHNEANGEDNRDGTDANQSCNGGVEGPSEDPDVERLRRRRQAGLLATLLLSLGTPMLAAGDELGRTQLGNNNAYCVDDESVWLDWAPSDQAEVLTPLLRALVDLRREHPLLGGETFLAGPVADTGPVDVRWLTAAGTELTGSDWHDPARTVIGMLLTGPVDGGRSEARLLVWLNRGADRAEVTLPADADGRSWKVRIDTAALTGDDGEEPAALEPGTRISLADYGVLALAG